MFQNTPLNITCSCDDYACKSQTCSYVMTGPFSKIAEEIFNRYNDAKLVVLKNRKSEKSFLAVKNEGGNSNRAEGRKLKRREMGYLVRVDHCPGTEGRKCGMQLQRSNIEILTKYNAEVKLHFNNCQNLCCGRGYSSNIETKEVKCKCRFSNSRMDVVCKSCSVPAVFFRCN